MVIRSQGPQCVNCGGRPGRSGLMCDGCWVAVPAAMRRKITTAWKALAARPSSAEARREYDLVIADAVGSIP